VYGTYPTAEEKALVGALERDLPKVFKWENVWRVAGGVNATDGGETHGLELEVLKLKDENDPKGEPLGDGLLRNEQELLFRAHNGGSQPLWLTAIYLDANLGIQVLYSAGINRGQKLKLAQATTTTKGGSVGLEGMVVFAIPQAALPVPPDFSMLEQEPLKVNERLIRGPRKGLDSPFERLLNQAAFHKGTRGVDLGVRSTPAILTQSWVLVP
jgi:hypothetical protein